MFLIYKIFKILIGFFMVLFGLFICKWLLVYATITGFGISLNVNIFDNSAPAILVLIAGFNLLILGAIASCYNLKFDKNIT